MKPTPHGEEEYDAWMEQTTHMLDKWKCSDIIKKQRIAESSCEYLKALETAFGAPDSAADLMVRFHNSLQYEGEELSATVDKLLRAVNHKGGIEVDDMNRACVEQEAPSLMTSPPFK